MSIMDNKQNEENPMKNFGQLEEADVLNYVKLMSLELIEDCETMTPEAIKLTGGALGEVYERLHEIYLAKWADDQRAAYAKGELSKDQIAFLEAVPGWDWCTS